MNSHFIQKAQKVHGSKYIYSKSDYVNLNTKLIIICKKHGEFKQTPAKHYAGRGCPKCANENKKLTTEDFIKKAQKIHGNRYDYSKSKYEGWNKKILIICPKHGEFKQLASSHIYHNKGCIKCGSNYWDINRLKQIILPHHKLLNENDNISSKSKITIKCLKCNTVFDTNVDTYSSSKHKCKKCSDKNLSMTTEDFIKKSKKIHNNLYEYDKTIYAGYYNELIINCKKHGEFKQTPNAHLAGCGCPKCPTIISKGHQEISDFLTSLNIKHNNNDRTQIKPLEIDILVPKYNLGIEFHGLYWHSHNSKETTKERLKHQHKHIQSIKSGIDLIQITEDEWNTKKDIIKSIIKHKCNLSFKIPARKCTITNLDNKRYFDFNKNNHIQGGKYSKIKIGLEYDGKLVQVIGLNEYNDHYEIDRICTLLNTAIIGGVSKLFKHIPKDKNIMTYANARYSRSDVYLKNGFELLYLTKPNYRYVLGRCTFSRHKFQKHKLKHNIAKFNPNLSESENMFNNGYRRIWDAGNYKLVLKV